LARQWRHPLQTVSNAQDPAVIAAAGSSWAARRADPDASAQQVRPAQYRRDRVDEARHGLGGTRDVHADVSAKPGQCRDQSPAGRVCSLRLLSRVMGNNKTGGLY